MVTVDLARGWLFFEVPACVNRRGRPLAYNRASLSPNGNRMPPKVPAKYIASNCCLSTTCCCACCAPSTCCTISFACVSCGSFLEEGSSYDAYADAQSELYYRTLGVMRNRRGWEQAGKIARWYARLCLCEDPAPPVEMSGVVLDGAPVAPRSSTRPAAEEMSRH